MADLPIVFDDRGLVPVVVQDHLSGEVRMIAFATREAVRATLTSGRATFWSRSRNELWEKGRTSGHTLHVKRILVDCNSDALVYSAEPTGPTCHTGAPSCFFQQLTPDGVVQKSEEPQTLLATVEAMLEARKASDGASSYTKSLYDGGAPAIGAKLREEADELARALESESDERVISESADVLYHLLVGLRWRAIPWRHVLGALATRMGTSGHAEKARRR